MFIPSKAHNQREKNSNMNLPTTLSLCLLYLPTFVRASSAVPAIDRGKFEHMQALLLSLSG